MSRVFAVLLTLLATALSPAVASAVDGDGETTFWLQLPTGNDLSAKLGADDDDYDLKIYRRGQQATYFGREGKVTPTTIDVKFGDFGEFVADYKPARTIRSREPNRHCTGDRWTTTEGFVRGVLRFRGEGGYVRIDTTKAKAKLTYHPPWKCDYPWARAETARLRPEKDTAVLIASAGSVAKRRIGLLASRSSEDGTRPYTGFLATSLEIRNGIGIARVTWARTRGAGFEFSHSAGTALIDPPAPFAGSARFKRVPDARDRWTGSLTVPFLGVGRVRLAGPRFHARLVPELLGFE